MADEVVTAAPVPKAAKPRRLGQLDGLRAVLLAVVMAHHAVWAAPGYAIHWVQGAWAALDGFFVLSGFLICGLLINEHDRMGSISYWQFLGRRVLRLYPALLVALATMATISVTMNKVPFHTLVPTLRSSLLYVMNWGFGHDNAAPGFPRNSFIAAEYTHFWSLAVEFQFYLALPIVVIVLYRLKWSRRAWLITFGVLMAAAAIARSVQWEGASHFPGPYVYTHTRADALLWGVVCALVLHWGWVGERFRRVLQWTGPLAIAYLAWVICAHSAMDAWTYDWGMIFSGLSGAIIVLWLVSSPTNPLARFLGWRPVVYLGERSYSGYLWHYPVYFFINAHLHALTGRERVAAGVAITIALSDLTFRLVERPVFSLKDRLIPRRIPAAVPDLPDVAESATAPG